MSLDQPDLSPEANIRLSYQAFLLRCWQEGIDGKSVWRFTLVQLDGGQVLRGFARLEDVSAYLQQTLASVSTAGEAYYSDELPER